MTMSVPPVVTSAALTASPRVRHAFFTRRGGVSQGLYASLNVGQGSRDDPVAVAENRRRAADWFDAPPERLLTAYQVHSARAVRADQPFGAERPQADAVVVAQPGLVCGALSADCAPVLLADSQAGVVAAAHAGWRGALGGICEATVAAMVEVGAAPWRITAAVGPCIGPQSYEVGLDFVEAFAKGDPGSNAVFRAGVSSDKRLFDLPAYVLERLARAGVTSAEWVGCDTLAEEELFFSNRRAVHRGEGDYGRLLSAIMLD